MKASISKRVGKRGVVWTAVLDLPPEPVTGKRRQTRLTAPTKKEVRSLAAQALTTIANGGVAEADAKKLTMDEYFTRWLEITAQGLKPSSHRRYVEITARHFRPFFGRLYLAKLSGLHIQSFYADRLGAGLSPTTVNMLHNILHRSLKQAVRLKLIVSNPMDSVDPPRKATPEMKYWDAHQAATFLTIADRDEWAALWRLAITTGMRRGELLALRWEDIDWAKGALAVRRTLSRGATGGYEFGTPKTHSGRRPVDLPLL